MKNFDRFVGIDWSGAKSPIHTKSIAVSMCGRGSEAPILLNAQWSRQKIAEWIGAQLKDHSYARMLIGVDANFGYAQSVGLEQFGASYDYKDIWANVERKSRPAPNYFAGPYWEHYPQYFWSQGKRPAHITLPQRIIEKACRDAGLGHPESPFKLIGAKQVGKGGLAAMRMAYDLKQKYKDAISIWPFEQDKTSTARIVITEIYPRQFLMRSGHGTTKIRDISALNASLEALRSNKINDTYRFNDHDTDAIISSAGLRMICGNKEIVPPNISNPTLMTEEAAKREGWIFGV